MLKSNNYKQKVNDNNKKQTPKIVDSIQNTTTQPQNIANYKRVLILTNEVTSNYDILENKLMFSIFQQIQSEFLLWNKEDLIKTIYYYNYYTIQQSNTNSKDNQMNPIVSKYDYDALFVISKKDTDTQILIKILKLYSNILTNDAWIFINNQNIKECLLESKQQHNIQQLRVDNYDQIIIAFKPY